MRLPDAKRRLVWLLVLMFFFFANLTLITILLMKRLSSHSPSAAPIPAATSQR